MTSIDYFLLGIGATLFVEMFCFCFGVLTGSITRVPPEEDEEGEDEAARQRDAGGRQ